MFNLPPAFILVGLVPLSLLFLRRHNRPAILTSLCLVIFLGGMAYYPSSLPVVDRNHLQFYNGQGMVTVKGVLDSDPDVGDKTTQIRLSSREVKLGEEWHRVSGTALLFVPRYPAYHYGDVLLVEGKLETPARLDDFDYPGYLAHQEIYATMLYPQIEVLSHRPGV